MQASAKQLIALGEPKAVRWWSVTFLTQGIQRRTPRATRYQRVGTRSNLCM